MRVIQEVKKMSEQKNRPVEKFIAGGVSAAVWHSTRMGREGKNIQIGAVTMDRRYRDKDGEFKNTNSLNMNDIPKAIVVLFKAYDFLVASGKGEKEEESG